MQATRTHGCAAAINELYDKQGSMVGVGTCLRRTRAGRPTRAAPLTGGKASRPPPWRSSGVKLNVFRHQIEHNLGGRRETGKKRSLMRRPRKAVSCCPGDERGPTPGIHPSSSRKPGVNYHMTNWIGRVSPRTCRPS